MADGTKLASAPATKAGPLRAGGVRRRGAAGGHRRGLDWRAWGFRSAPGQAKCRQGNQAWAVFSSPLARARGAAETGVQARRAAH